ncbi:MAG TPA: hypothetical protein VJH63_04500 [Candidatus Paceibacterota bacterium]
MSPTLVTVASRTVGALMHVIQLAAATLFVILLAAATHVLSNVEATLFVILLAAATLPTRAVEMILLQDVTRRISPTPVRPTSVVCWTAPMVLIRAGARSPALKNVELKMSVFQTTKKEFV